MRPRRPAALLTLLAALTAPVFLVTGVVGCAPEEQEDSVNEYDPNSEDVKSWEESQNNQ